MAQSINGMDEKNFSSGLPHVDDSGEFANGEASTETHFNKCQFIVCRKKCSQTGENDWRRWTFAFHLQIDMECSEMSENN